MVQQLLWGSLVLGICLIIHVASLIGAITLLGRLAKWCAVAHLGARISILLGSALVIIIFAHILEVSIWAASLLILGTTADLAEATYFALVTYTTVGYGDVTLGEPHRLYAVMAAVTGLLNFGLSTAFLASVMGKLVPRDHLRG